MKSSRSLLWFIGLFRLLSIWILTSFPLAVEAAFPPKLEKPALRSEFDQAIRTAMKKVIPPAKFSDFESALASENKTALHYQLSSQHLFTLEGFVQKLARPLSNLFGSTRTKFKLSPIESAAVLLFYVSLNPTENGLARNQMLRRSDARIANGLRQITRWPYTPVRIHGQDQPLANYDPQQWKDAAAPFVRFGLANEFLILRSQFVNYEAAQLTHRHIAGFDEKFFLHLQKVAFKQNQPRLAQLAFLAYLASTKTEPVINELEAKKFSDTDLPDAIERNGNTVGEFAWAISRMRTPELLRLFRTGQTPRRLKIPNPSIVTAALEYFKKKPYIDSAVQSLHATCTK